MIRIFNTEKIKEIEEKQKKWQEDVKNVTLRDSYFETDSGIKVKPIYTPADIKNFDYLRDTGFPGEPPYTRGPYLKMYRSRFWTIRLFSGYGTPEETNERWHMLLKEGETGFSAAVDGLTFNGIDPDDPRGSAEIGTSGVPLYCIDSMFALTKGLPIDKISVALITEPFSSAPICGMYFNMAKSKGIDLNNVIGTCQNDILTQTVGYNAYKNCAPEYLLELACDLIEFTTCQKNVPKWHPINFTTYNYREGGIDAIQELGFGFASAIEHIDELLRRGYKIDDFADRLAFHLAAHKDFFEEIAKFRAARKIWYTLMKDKYEAKNPRSRIFRFHIQTAGSSLTAEQPLNNAVRTAYQAMSAALGGAQSMHTNGYDEAYCLVSEPAVMLALRTQQIIQEETRVCNTIDPLAGSYYVEWLTSEIEEKVWKYLGEFEKAGGIVKSLESGWIYKEMRNAFQRREKNINSGRETVIGVNKYVMKEEVIKDVFRTNEKAEEVELNRIKKLKSKRDNKKVEQYLDELRRTCEKRENVMPVVMKATKEGATVGEICGIYREIWGIWDPPIMM